jgi:methionine sulfoxide reductase catalytic subunit
MRSSPGRIGWPCPATIIWVFARYWHSLTTLGWMVVGLFYLLLLFRSPQWRRLVPTSWDIIPCAGRSMIAYLTFDTPEPTSSLYSISPSLPFNALQQLTYFGLIFIATPFQILTGLAQSPSLIGRFPWYMRLFGHRQVARSLHFLGLVMFAGFFGIHLVMVVWHGFAAEMDKMVLGHTHSQGSWLGVGLGLGIITVVVLIHAAANFFSVKTPRRLYLLLSSLVDPIREKLLHNLCSAQHYPDSQISPYFRTNGYPPISSYPQAKGDDDTYERLLRNQFVEYRLEVKGLVEHPHKFSLEELRSMPKQEQTTLHNCIQGWTSVGRWGGVPMREILDRCKPLPQTRYLVFTSFAKHEKSDKIYYECVSLDVAYHPQTLLAYELNGQELPIQNGAPLRVRFETKLGFKMVKYLRSIEFIEDYRTIGGGLGGIREDMQEFDMGAEI